MDVFVRIFLRYLAGALVVKGILDADLGNELATDPDVIAFVQMAVGAVVAFATERWYAIAKRMGWNT